MFCLVCLIRKALALRCLKFPTQVKGPLQLSLKPLQTSKIWNSSRHLEPKGSSIEFQVLKSSTKLKVFHHKVSHENSNFKDLWFSIASSAYKHVQTKLKFRVSFGLDWQAELKATAKQNSKAPALKPVPKTGTFFQSYEAILIYTTSLFVVLACGPEGKALGP